MQGYWSTRKNIYEQAIVSHRNREDDFRSKWSDTANYFKKSDVRAAKQNAWSSTQAFQDRCMDAYEESVEKDVKSSNLKRRRDKLGRLFAEENKAYEAELKGISRPSTSRLDDMRARADDLKSAREEKRQKLAEEKLYQHWRENNPELRKAEAQLLQEHVVGEWGDQVVEKEERLESARRENEAFARQMEEERQAAVQLERRREEEKLREEKSLREVLREQMIEFKTREAEEQDRKLLESLIEKEKEDVALQTARKEQTRADAQWMKQVIEDQLKLEKAREAELDMLYQDEAARMWQKRDSEWERERQARQRLMSEVLEERQAQISEQLAELQQQQEESLLRREELVREMEIAQRQAKMEEEERERGKLTTRAELEGQMLSRQQQEVEAKERARFELRHERQDEEDYEDLLRQETERMRLKGYTPRVHGRKQAWM
ncbi:glycolipid transfer protein [Plakobranchus ocellatus]|uniref:Trichoplein keratin filament-binding protein n=1 Tax=Plakobranchus ocellatus TaxID=259542 RepID=A0AAV4CMW5_9GAST|nr:glycolipid transfer protein [Plakobranchus ocellatus]